MFQLLDFTVSKCKKNHAFLKVVVALVLETRVYHLESKRSGHALLISLSLKSRDRLNERSFFWMLINQLEAFSRRKCWLNEWRSS